MVDINLLLVGALIVLFAYIVKGATGFGENLILVPLFLYFYDIKYVLPLTLLIVIAADIYLAYKFYQKADWQLIKIITIFSLGGLLISSYFLVNLPSQLIKTFFAVFVTGFSLYSLLFSPKSHHKGNANPISSGIVGFSGGLLSGLIGAEDHR